MVRGATRRERFRISGSWKCEEIRQISDYHKEGTSLRSIPRDPSASVRLDSDPRSPSHWHITKDPGWTFETYKSVSSGEEKELDIIGGLPSV